MKRKKYINIFLVIGAICLLVLPSIQAAMYNPSIAELNKSDKVKDTSVSDTFHFQNCIIWVVGKCKNVGGALTWIFGFYCPLFKKNLWIQASGQENEALTVFVRGGGVGTYIDYENILIDLNGATGILYWFGKSWINKGDSIFARCKVDDCWITIP